MKRGDVLRVIDPQGEQVSDLFAFRDGDPAFDPIARSLRGAAGKS